MFIMKSNAFFAGSDVYSAAYGAMKLNAVCGVSCTSLSGSDIGAMKLKADIPFSSVFI